MVSGISRRFRIGLHGLAALVLCLYAFRLTAQENFEIPIAFIGEIRAMNGDVIQVDLLSIDIAQARVDVDIAVGALVAVEGLLRIDGTIAANTVTAYAPPATSVTAVVGAIPTTETAFTPTPPAPAAASMVIVGPLQTVTATRITIYGIEIQLDPTVPLPPLRVGEMVRVQAEQVDGVIVARNIIYDPSS